MRDLGPGEIAALVAMLMSLVVWVGALRDARRWQQFQQGARKRKDPKLPPGEPDNPDRPRGPWDRPDGQ